MKFKLIFLLFNGIIAVSFLFVFLMPLIFLGPEYARVFWLENWYLAAVFILIIGGLNAYFAMNRRLFALLESEDWHGLVEYLEHSTFIQHRYSLQRLRILINTYIVLADPDKIRALEEDVRTHKARLLPRLALEFGIPRLLRNDPDEMIHFYGEYRTHSRAEHREWLTWSYCFALMQRQRGEEALELLRPLAESGRNPLLQLFALYLLDAFREGRPELAESIDVHKESYRKQYSGARLQQEIEKNRSNLQVVVLARLVKNAEEWVMSDGKASFDAGAMSGNGSSTR